MKEELFVSEKLSSVGFYKGMRRLFSCVSVLISSINDDEWSEKKLTISSNVNS